MAARELRAGLKAPAFKLDAAGADQVSLKDHRGKWVVLFYYPKASTSG